MTNPVPGCGAAAGLALALAVALPAAAQELATPILQGTVTVGAERPLPGAMVVLHRVDAVEAGELDSIPAGAGGTFRFELPTVPDPANRGDVYFASVWHQGVLYFGSPLTTGVQLDSVYQIQVHDTTVVPAGGAALTPAVRYMLLEDSPDGWQVTDLFMLEVEGDRTLVAADSGAVWRYPLPSGLRNLQVGGGDVPPAAAGTEGGDLVVTAPLVPGPRQIVVRYVLDSLTVDIPLPGGVGEMDLLVREPAPPVEVQGLAPSESVELEAGERYRRFTGVAVEAQVIRLAQGDAPWRLSARWMAVLLGLLLTVAGIYAVLHSPGAGTRRSAPPAGPGGAEEAPGLSREALILQVAELDETLDELTDGPARERLLHRRGTLLAELRRRG